MIIARTGQMYKVFILLGCFCLTNSLNGTWFTDDYTFEIKASNNSKIYTLHCITVPSIFAGCPIHIDGTIVVVGSNRINIYFAKINNIESIPLHGTIIEESSILFDLPLNTWKRMNHQHSPHLIESLESLEPLEPLEPFKPLEQFKSLKTSKSSKSSSLSTLSTNPWINNCISQADPESNNVSSSIASRLSTFSIGNQHHITSGRHGTFLTSLQDPWIGKSLRQYGEWSNDELKLFTSLISKGDIVIDAGANIGSFTIPLAKYLGSSGKIFAFEAQRRLHHILSANIAINNLMNVRNPHLALSNETGVGIQIPNVNFSMPGNFGAVSLVDKEYRRDQTHTIYMTSIDTWFMEQWLLKGEEMEDSNHQRICPALIKIDVEGMEELILQGSLQLINRCQPILYIENNCIKDSPGILNLLMETLNYDVAWDVTPYYSLDNWKNSSIDIFHGLHAVNVLAVPSSNINSVHKNAFKERVQVVKESYLLKEYSVAVGEKIGREAEWVSTLQTGNETYCNR